MDPLTAELFAKGFSQGAAAGTNAFHAFEGRKRQDKEFEAAEQARKFREAMQSQQDFRARGKHEMDLGAAQKQAEVDDMNLQMTREKFEGRFDAARAAAEQSALEAKRAEELHESKLKDAKAGRAAKWASTAIKREQLKELKQARKSKAAAAAKVLEIETAGGLVDWSATQPGQPGFRKNVNAAQKYLDLKVKAGQMDSKEARKLKENLDGLAALEREKQSLAEQFADVEGITGFDDFGEAMTTLAGRSKLVRGIYSDAGVNARKLQDLNAKLRLMVISMQKAEPNSKRAQNLIQERFHISETTSQEELLNVLENLNREMSITQANAREALSSAGVFTSGGMPTASGTSSDPIQVTQPPFKSARRR